MSFIDDRGRLFGRINLIDLAVVVVVLLAIPIGYGAYRLFREPVPTILTIEPAQVTTTNLGNVKITGQNLRAELKARVGTEDATLLVANPTTGEIKLSPKLGPGTYDIVLYDEQREISKKPQAITIVAPTPPPPPSGPQMEMQAVGVFVSVSDDNAKWIRAGMKFFDRPGNEDTIADILAVKEPGPAMSRVKTGPTSSVSVAASPGAVQVPAIVRLRCQVIGDQCRVGDAAMVEGGNVSFMAPAAEGSPEFHVTFRIDELRPADTPAAFPSVRELEVQAVGVFISLTPGDARLIRNGSTLTRPNIPERQRVVATVLAAKPASTSRQKMRVTVDGQSVIETVTPGLVQVPAILRLHCFMVGDQCRVGDNVLQRNVTLPLLLVVQGTGGSRGRMAPVWFDEREMTFRIDELRPSDARPVFPSADAQQVTMRVQFVVRPEIASLIAVGDADPNGPTLTAVAVHPEPVPYTATVPSAVGTSQLQQTGRIVDATVRLSPTPVGDGWEYQNRPLRAGDPFTFGTPAYTIAGTILHVQASKPQTSSDSK